MEIYFFNRKDGWGVELTAFHGAGIISQFSPHRSYAAHPQSVIDVTN